MNLGWDSLQDWTPVKGKYNVIHSILHTCPALSLPYALYNEPKAALYTEERSDVSNRV